MKLKQVGWLVSDAMDASYKHWIDINDHQRINHYAAHKRAWVMQALWVYDEDHTDRVEGQ